MSIFHNELMGSEAEAKKFQDALCSGDWFSPLSDN